jgi:phosphoglucosamine mutase
MGSRKKQYFGTDGIRGTVGTAPITPDFMLKLGWAAGRVFGNDDGARKKNHYWQGHTHLWIYV